MLFPIVRFGIAVRCQGHALRCNFNGYLIRINTIVILIALHLIPDVIGARVGAGRDG